MWNRVALLVAGVAFGWSLVHWASAADRQRTHLLRCIGALVVGVGLAAWLGSDSLAAGVVALAVFAIATLVAYAANARQVDRIPEPEPRLAPDKPLEGQHGLAMLVLLEGEPRTYDGPAQWAPRLHRHAQAGHRIRHWLARPWDYYRIRRAYQAMGDIHPQRAAVDALMERVRPLIAGVDALDAAWLYTTPTLVNELTRLALRGLRHVVVVPLEETVSAATLHEDIARARIAEIGVLSTIAPALKADLWPLPPSDVSLDGLLRGEPSATPAAPSDAQVAALAQALQRRALPGPEW